MLTPLFFVLVSESAIFKRCIEVCWDHLYYETKFTWPIGSCLIQVTLYMVFSALATSLQGYTGGYPKIVRSGSAYLPSFLVIEILTDTD